jgi:hypothetical protein
MFDILPHLHREWRTYGARVIADCFPDLTVWANLCRAYGAGFGMGQQRSIDRRLGLKAFW